MKQINFWKSKPIKKLNPKPKLELPKTKDLVKLGIGLTVLGVGVAAFKEASS